MQQNKETEAMEEVETASVDPRIEARVKECTCGNVDLTPSAHAELCPYRLKHDTLSTTVQLEESEMMHLTYALQKLESEEPGTLKALDLETLQSHCLAALKVFAQIRSTGELPESVKGAKGAMKRG